MLYSKLSIFQWTVYKRLVSSGPSFLVVRNVQLLLALETKVIFLMHCLSGHMRECNIIQTVQ